METKKSKKADLERYRTIFLLVGLTISLALVLSIFEWESETQAGIIPEAVRGTATLEELPPVTRPEKKEAVKQPLMVTEFKLVDDGASDLPDPDIFIPEIFEGMPVFAQVKPEVVKEDTTFFIWVDEMPEFPGGMKALIHFLAQSVKYPPVAKQNNVQGKVFVQFVVDAKGQVTHAKVIRSVDEALDQEALRVVNNMPLWKPGKQAGKPVKVGFTVPINFVLM